jgi:hypothetical protein
VEGGIAHLELTASVLLGDRSTQPPGEESDMISTEAAYLGSRLDEHHPPETNGRMAVCRRCGTHTDSPEGSKHQPDERQLARSNEWLDKQDRASRIQKSMALFRS